MGAGVTWKTVEPVPAMSGQRLPVVTSFGSGMAEVFRCGEAMEVGKPLMILAILSWALFKMPPVLWIMLSAAPIFIGLNAIICVTVYRGVLLGPGSIPSKSGLYFTEREWRYSGWLALMTTILFLTQMAGKFLVIPAVSEAMGGENLGARALAVLIYYPPMLYILGRGSLILPATALDRKMGLREVWRVSRGNGARLGALMFISTLPAIFLRYGVPQLFPDYPVLIGISLVVSHVTLLFPAAALAVAYRRLIGVEAHAYDPPIGYRYSG